MDAPRVASDTCTSSTQSPGAVARHIVGHTGATRWADLLSASRKGRVPHSISGVRGEVLSKITQPEAAPVATLLEISPNKGQRLQEARQKWQQSWNAAEAVPSPEVTKSYNAVRPVVPAGAETSQPVNQRYAFNSRLDDSRSPASTSNSADGKQKKHAYAHMIHRNAEYRHSQRSDLGLGDGAAKTGHLHMRRRRPLPPNSSPLAEKATQEKSAPAAWQGDLLSQTPQYYLHRVEQVHDQEERRKVSECTFTPRMYTKNRSHKAPNSRIRSSAETSQSVRQRRNILLSHGPRLDSSAYVTTHISATSSANNSMITTSGSDSNSPARQRSPAQSKTSSRCEVVAHGEDADNKCVAVQFPYGHPRSPYKSIMDAARAASQKDCSSLTTVEKSPLHSEPPRVDSRTASDVAGACVEEAEVIVRQQVIGNASDSDNLGSQNDERGQEVESLTHEAESEHQPYTGLSFDFNPESSQDLQESERKSPVSGNASDLSPIKKVSTPPSEMPVSTAMDTRETDAGAVVQSISDVTSYANFGYRGPLHEAIVIAQGRLFNDSVIATGNIDVKNNDDDNHGDHKTSKGTNHCGYEHYVNNSSRDQETEAKKDQKTNQGIDSERRNIPPLTNASINRRIESLREGTRLTEQRNAEKNAGLNLRGYAIMSDDSIHADSKVVLNSTLTEQERKDLPGGINHAGYTHYVNNLYNQNCRQLFRQDLSDDSQAGNEEHTNPKDDGVSAGANTGEFDKESPRKANVESKGLDRSSQRSPGRHSSPNTSNTSSHASQFYQIDSSGRSANAKGESQVNKSRIRSSPPQIPNPVKWNASKQTNKHKYAVGTVSSALTNNYLDYDDMPCESSRLIGEHPTPHITKQYMNPIKGHKPPEISVQDVCLYESLRTYPMTVLSRSDTPDADMDSQGFMRSTSSAKVRNREKEESRTSKKKFHEDAITFATKKVPTTMKDHTILYNKPETFAQNGYFGYHPQIRDKPEGSQTSEKREGYKDSDSSDSEAEREEHEVEPEDPVLNMVEHFEKRDEKMAERALERRKEAQTAKAVTMRLYYGLKEQKNAEKNAQKNYVDRSFVHENISDDTEYNEAEMIEERKQAMKRSKQSALAVAENALAAASQKGKFYFGQHKIEKQPNLLETLTMNRYAHEDSTGDEGCIAGYSDPAVAMKVGLLSEEMVVSHLQTQIQADAEAYPAQSGSLLVLPPPPPTPTTTKRIDKYYSVTAGLGNDTLIDYHN